MGWGDGDSQVFDVVASTDTLKDWEKGPMLKLGLQSYFLDIPVDD